jgi:ABC-type dipeptide/oligopeptide/nickel transport system permease component
MSGFLAYLSRRLVAAVITLLGVIAVLVFTFQVLPGDPARVIAGLRASPEQVAKIRHTMGLDQPVVVQYWRYLDHIAHGNLGTSPRTGHTVLSEIASRLPYTIELAILGTLLGVIFGIPLGIWAATHKGKWADALGSIIGVMGISMPVFWTGILLIVLFGVVFKLLPVSGADTPASYILPSITLGVFSMAIISRMTRSTMIETLDQDYIRTVRGKGVRENVAVRHALRNAFIPILTVISLQFGTVLGGAVLTETIFSWPGIGRLLVTSIQSRDFPTVEGIVLVFAAMFILVNLITDLLYSVIDPRVKLYR